MTVVTADSTSRPIRVMHILPFVFSGGVETRRRELAKLLDPTQFEQKILCLSGSGPLRADIENYGVEVLSRRTRQEWTPFDVLGLSWVIYQIARWKPDIVHGAVFEGVSMATLAGTLCRTPIIILEETGDPSVRSWRGDALLRGLSQLADACVGVSPAVGDYLKNDIGWSEQDIHQIDNGVASFERQPPEVGRRLRRKWDIDEDAFLVGTVGRMLNSQKRFTDLIDAISLLKEELDRLHLIVVGTGGDLDMLKEYAAEKGIKERVTFTGYQYNVDEYYSMMDAFALLSEHESFGLVVAEAMFCELPVIATRVGGMQHIVIDEETGFLVEPFNPKQAASAIRKLYESDSLCRRMATAGRARAEKRYGSQRYAKDVEKLYLDLIEEKGLR